MTKSNCLLSLRIRFAHANAKILLLLLALATLFGERSVSAAASDTWANTGTSYDLGGDWLGGVAPTTTGYTAVFTGTPTFQPIITVPTTTESIDFAGGATGYDLTSSSTSDTLTLGAGSSDIVSGAPTTADTIDTVAAPIIFSATTAGITAGYLSSTTYGTLTNTLIISGQISSSNASSTVLTFGSNGTPQGVVEILGTNNTYGSTIIADSLINFEVEGLATSTSAGSLGAAAVNFEQSNGGYYHVDYIGGTLTSDQVFYLPPVSNETGHTDTFQLSTVGATGALTLTTNITSNVATTAGYYNDQLVLTSNDNFGDTFSGVYSNGTETGTFLTNQASTASLVKTGTGSWTLTNANTYTGGTGAYGGNLILSFANTGLFSATIGVVSSSSALSVGAENILQTTSGFVTGSGTITIAGAANTADVQTFNGVTFETGASHIDLTTSGSGTMVVELGADNTIGQVNGATQDFSIPAGTTLETTSSPTLVNGLMADAATINGTDFATISGGDIVSDSANYHANGATSFTAGEIIDMSAGSTTLSATSTTIAALRFNNDVTSGSTTTGTTLTLGTTASGGAATLVISNGSSNSSSGESSAAILVTPNVGAYTTDITGGTLEGDGNGKGLELLQNNTAGMLEIDSAIVNNGTSATALTKSGLGTVLLTGTNTFSGGTYINEGILEYQNEVSFADNFSVSYVLSVGNGAVAAFAVGGAGEFTISATGESDLGYYLSYAGFQNGSYLGLDTTSVGAGGTFADSYALGNNGANSIGLVKLGVGTLQLTGNNTYSGNTLVRTGTLALSSSTSNNNIPNSVQVLAGDTQGDTTAVLDVTGITAPGGFQVQSGQTLGGYGSVNGNVTMLSGSTISPGTNGAGGNSSAVGTLAITNGNLTLNQGTTFIFDLNGVGASDQVTVSGTLTLNGQQFTDFTFNTLTTVAPGQQYTLMSSASAVAGALGTDQTGYVDGYMSSIDISGDDLLLEVASVPEPSTWILVVLGGMALLMFYRRRRCLP